MEKILFYRRLLLSVFIFLWGAQLSYAQTQNPAPVTLKKANITVAEVFQSIKKQTGLTVFYSNSLLNDQELVTVDFDNATLKDVFTYLLKGKNLHYVLRDQLIVIEKVAVEKPVPAATKKEQVQAPPPQKIVQGTVTDDKGLTLPGVSVKVKGTQLGTQSDVNGKFSINLKTTDKTIITFSFVGSKTQEFDLISYQPVNGVYIVDVAMGTDKTALEEVAVVAYGTQKKSSLVSSITTISPKQLKGPSSNLTTMLAGVVPGMISYQRSGEPGADNAQFFIRGVGTFGAGKVDPLILIDGIESTTTDLARLQPDDIAGFSVLKDATASSLYGARGANGVILVTTKRGDIGPLRFNVRAENSTSSNIKNIDLADNISYMTLANEAVLTRNALGILPYSQNKIDHTAKGDDPLLYPSNNWIKQLIKTKTSNQRFNMNANGGTEKAKYYLAMTYNIDNGNLAENNLNSFSNNIKLQSYSILSNTTLNLTKTTEAVVSLKGQFDSYRGPINGGGFTFLNALWSNPVAFPAIYPANLLPYVNHPLFGNAIIPGGGLYINPYAQSLSGFQTSNTSTLTAQLNLNQKFDFITNGLSARVMAYTTRYSYFSVGRQYSPYYYQSNVVNGQFNGLTLINNGQTGSIGNNPTEYLTYSPGGSVSNATTYIETAVNYNRTFAEKHAISGLLIGIMRNYLTANAPTLQLSLPSRNQGVSGRFTYGYDNRYLLEFNFGYNGSERFASNHRFGFFPSVGAGWVVSNEKFFEPLLSTIDNLKFRATYGLVGNDQIGSANDRFFYLSDVNLNNGSNGQFGTNYTYSRPGIVTNRYENQNITWEQSRQTNLGMDLTLAKSFTLTLDAYQNKRDNILMVRSTIPTSMGLQADISSNAGKTSSKGVDIAMDYKKNFSNSFWIQSRGTLTYAKSKLLKNEEPIYPANLQYLSKVGNSLSQIYGLVAERLFIDDKDVANSPVQSFGDYKAGDIKYRDMNGDGKISSLDVVPIGYPQVPEIIYGFGFSVGYKNFDISAFFQGSARSSFIINSADISPFYLVNGLQTNGLNTGNQSGLLSSIANDHWSEDNRNPYAFYPRLSTNIQLNNTQSSTWWLRDGSFLRLKSAEIGYNFNKKQLKSIHLNSARIYVNGLNLLTLSSFKLWDPEMGTSGLGYPIQKVFNLGLRVEF
ncbi:TonB-dependent receptor [Mucilaginibacter sp. FT3.2]|uniref:TonB-dependent receptor n=1 Tax=Mucilaginibacter sp. FT3.2 TaxID=2723090 RepID=UPI0016114D45|nr:TonB-dependent receptor [Mucilaginibacter sp. FT3.2]MBB6231967.1 TonB-linked SusC/RagA family outer membrane protein [Mucilaginibacter sp. FT3.2]